MSGLLQKRTTEVGARDIRSAAEGDFVPSDGAEGRGGGSVGGKGEAREGKELGGNIGRVAWWGQTSNIICVMCSRFSLGFRGG